MNKYNNWWWTDNQLHHCIVVSNRNVGYIKMRLWEIDVYFVHIASVCLFLIYVSLINAWDEDELLNCDINHRLFTIFLQMHRNLQFYQERTQFYMKLTNQIQCNDLFLYESCKCKFCVWNIEFSGAWIFIKMAFCSL